MAPAVELIVGVQKCRLLLFLLLLLVAIGLFAVVFRDAEGRGARCYS